MTAIVEAATTARAYMCKTVAPTPQEWALSIQALGWSVFRLGKKRESRPLTVAGGVVAVAATVWHTWEDVQRARYAAELTSGEPETAAERAERTACRGSCA